MMKTMDISQGELVDMEAATLSKGTFIKIQAQSVDFLDITDPKAV